MAITKIHPIKFSTLSAIEYITNPEKTDGQLLVSTYHCEAPIADLQFLSVAKRGQHSGSVKAQHLIQSFAPGEVDAKTAHEIGLKLVKRLTKGKHQFVLATHIDHDHIHNHIIFAHTDFMEYKKFRMNMSTFKEMQMINDELCASYGLSVVEHKNDKTRTYYDWQKVRKSKTAKEVLKRNIDLCISISTDFDTFLLNMQKLGYEVKNTGTYYSFKLPEHERFKRLKTLGEDYTEEGIKKRIYIRSFSASSIPSTTHNKSQLVSGIKQDISNKNAAYKNAVASSDAKKIAATYNFLSSRDLLSFSKLDEYVENLRSSKNEIRKSLKEVEDKLSALSDAKGYLENLNRYVGIYQKYIASGKDSAFFNKHRAQILLYEGAKNSLKQLEIDQNLDASEVAKQIEELLLQKQMLKNELQLNAQSLSEVSDHYQNARFVLGMDTKDPTVDLPDEKSKVEKSEKDSRKSL